MGQAPVAEVAHIGLRLGRLMLVNGADADDVHAAVDRLAAGYGFKAHLLVHTEGLALTLEDETGFRTKVGPSVAGLTVNMHALTRLDEISRATAQGARRPSEIDAELAQIETSRRRYPQWLVSLGMGVTAAALARLFGGDWVVVGVTVIVGVVTQSLRAWLTKSAANPVGGAALAAFGGGLAGALIMKAFPAVSPTLCLVAAGMILVPGVPLINGVRDTLASHTGLGIARLTMATVMVLSIALGLFLAAALAGDSIPVDETFVPLPVVEDFVFSAIAGVGFALLFNVPPAAAWACAACSMTGHGLRTALVHMGADLAVGSLAAAFACTLLARALAARLGVVPVVFAVPGVVAMIPGAYAFRAGSGGLNIMGLGADAPPALVGETIGLAVTAVVVTAAIAIGLCLALAAPFPEGKKPFRMTGA